VLEGTVELNFNCKDMLKCCFLLFIVAKEQPQTMNQRLYIQINYERSGVMCKYGTSGLFKGSVKQEYFGNYLQSLQTFLMIVTIGVLK